MKVVPEAVKLVEPSLPGRRRTPTKFAPLRQFPSGGGPLTLGPAFIVPPVIRSRIALVIAVAALGLAATGCGEDGQEVDSRGAELFAERCSGCHTLEAAGTEGSNPEERVAGPNLHNRKETKSQV